MAEKPESTTAETPQIKEVLLKDLDPRLIKQVETAEKSIDKDPSYAINVCLNILSKEPSCAEVRKILRKAQRAKFGKGNPVSVFLAKLSGSIFASKAKKMVSKGKQKEVLAEGEKLLTQCPLNTPVIKVMAEAASSLGLNQTATDLYSAVAAAEPGNVKVLIELCKIYLKNKQADDAVRLVSLIMSKDPSNNEAQAILKEAAVIKTMSNSWKEGDDSDFRSKVKDADNAANLEKAARLVNDADTLNQNVERLKVEIGNDLENINLYRDIASNLKQLGRFSEAVDYVKQARALPMGKGDTALEKLEQDLIVSDKDQQITVCNKALESNPNDEAAKSKLETLKAEVRVFKLATAKAMVERYPNDFNYRYTLGVLLFEDGAVDEAIGQFQLSQRSPKVRLQSLLGLGKAFMIGKKYDMAVDQFLTAKKESVGISGDTKKEIIYELAAAYEIMGDRAKAIEEYKEIYKGDINYKDVAAKINSFYEKK